MLRSLKKIEAVEENGARAAARIDIVCLAAGISNSVTSVLTGSDHMHSEFVVSLAMSWPCRQTAEMDRIVLERKVC